MAKRARSDTVHSSHQTAKKQRTGVFSPNKIATADAASAVDENPPLQILLKAVESRIKNVAKGDCVVYWMRMADLRVSDNRALSMASSCAQEAKIPLVVLFGISPQDYVAHDRAERRIDFTLRNLRLIQTQLADLNIPLHVETINSRQKLPERIVEFVSSINCKNLFANYEYEVDELRRDIKVSTLAKDKGVAFSLIHNKCIVEPGVIRTGAGKPPAVYSPYFKKWAPAVSENIPWYLEDAAPPQENDADIRTDKTFQALFDSQVPDFVEGFRLEDEDRKRMEECWPAGEEAAADILERYLSTKSRKTQLGAADPLADGAEKSASGSRVKVYHKSRDLANADSTSRLSPYLSAGVISIRECVRAGMRISKIKGLDTSKDTGIGRWNSELAWRDFYTNVLASWPRVSMGRPWLEKYDPVVWEPAQESDEEGHLRDTKFLKAWKEGQTGYPIVDAGMRCLTQMGWVHNRLRMITAMFLTKHLLIDWRVGERFYMENLIDGDLASNNGGWQWCASTGVDPCPYFRIFNPYSQSPKADPDGDFIRAFVPELAALKGKDIHQPSQDSADALGYPRPIVDHSKARERALRRFKNIGEE